MGANVGAPVAGDTEGLPGVSLDVPVVGALALVVAVSATGLRLGDPGVTVGFLWWEPLQWEPMWGHQRLETQRGLQESQWVFLWWEHWHLWWGFQFHRLTTGDPGVSGCTRGWRHRMTSRSQAVVPVVGALTVVVGVPVTGLKLGDPGVKVGDSVVGATAMGAIVGAPEARDTEGPPGVTVGVPVVGVLAVVMGVPVTGLPLGDPGVTVGVSVVGATAMEANVGAPVDGDTEGLPGVSAGVPVV
jgi:hypothetical protein